MKRPALLMLTVITVACSPAPDPEEVSGSWVRQSASGQDERQIMVLDESSRLHLLGFQDRQGRRWETDGGQLRVEMLSRSSGMEVSENLSYSLTDPDSLHISGASPLAGNYARDEQATLRLEGSLTLPEDHEFPSGSVLALVLEGVDPNGEVTEAMDHQLEPLAAGGTHTDYQIYLDPQQLVDADRYRLSARIIVDGAPMYAGREVKELDPDEGDRQFDFALEGLGNAAGATPGPGEADEHSRIRHGHYLYFADTATFTECTTGRRWPVAGAGIAEQLQNTYLDRREDARTPILVSLSGQVEQRQRNGTEGQPLQLRPERLLQVLPTGSECISDQAVLEDVYWKATHLDDTELQPGDTRGEPHLILDSEEQKAHGNLGCNRFRSSYESDDDRLSFSAISITRKRCERGRDVETVFSEALERTRGYRLEGTELQLHDEDDSVLAELQAFYRLP